MEIYHTGWRALPNRYSTTKHNLGHCGHLDPSPYYESPFLSQAIHRRQPTFTSQPVYTLRTDLPLDSAMSTTVTYTACGPTADFRQDWNRSYEITPPESLHGNDSGDCTVFNHLAESQAHSNISPCLPLETLDPRKMQRRPRSCSIAESATQYLPDIPQFGQNYESPPYDYDSPLYLSTVYQEQSTMFGEDEDDNEPPEGFVNSSPTKHIQDDNKTTEKPYAKLIYEALMQASGHKMMLRDIYDWFMINTTKPQESEGNGWQNSIRHNLSMNQAFENEKSNTSCGKGHSRKANSVWMLTDHAVKYGVQSTTRYRKPGTVKKSAANRAPAIERQRSGARGGRATRKCAIRVKKEDDTFRASRSVSAMSTIPCFQSQSKETGEGAARLSPRSHYSQPTPATDTDLESKYALSPFFSARDTVHPSKFDDYDVSVRDNGMSVYDDLFDPCWTTSLDEFTKNVLN